MYRANKQDTIVFLKPVSVSSFGCSVLIDCSHTTSDVDMINLQRETMQ